MRRVRVITLIVVVALLAPVATAWAALVDDDLVSDSTDLCPDATDPFQFDSDRDGIGDLCDPDTATFDLDFTFTDGPDLVLGSNGDDVMDGLGGDDALYGEEGDDVLDGGPGDDLLAGGPGVNTLTGGSGCDVFAIEPSTSDDTITDFTPGLDRFALPRQDDDPADDPAPTFTVGDVDSGGVVLAFDDGGVVTLDGVTSLTALDTRPCAPPPCRPATAADGTPGNDILRGGDGDDEFDGDFGNDIIIGGFGDDDLDGEDGNDFVSGDACHSLTGDQQGGDDDVEGDEDDDLLFGDAPVAILDNASGGDDFLDGDEGDDIMYGDAPFVADTASGGDDVFYGGQGDDELWGGPGEDLALFDSLDPADFAYEYIGPGRFRTYDLVVGGCPCEPDDGSDLLDSIEYAWFLGFLLDEPAPKNGGGWLLKIVMGDPDDNTIDGDDETDELILGFDGDDALTGDGAGTIGESTLSDDGVIGGDGDDLISGDVGGSLVVGSEGGWDSISGGAGDDIIYGDAGSSIDSSSVGGDDYILGGAGEDSIVGDASFLNGEGGWDLIDGGSGHDIIAGDAEIMFGDSIGGNDIVLGRGGHDVIHGDAGIALAGAGETVTGGDDLLIGGNGNDTIYGDFAVATGFSGTVVDGNDEIVGGAGDDTLWGDSPGNSGGGHDEFKYDVTEDSGNDVIKDFDIADDQLELMGVSNFDGDGDLDADDLDHPDSGMSVADDGTDVLVDFGGNGSTLIEGIGNGTINSFAALDAVIDLDIEG